MSGVSFPVTGHVAVWISHASVDVSGSWLVNVPPPVMRPPVASPLRSTCPQTTVKLLSEGSSGLSSMSNVSKLGGEGKSKPFWEMRSASPAGVPMSSILL